MAGVCCRMREGLRAELLGQTLEQATFPPALHLPSRPLTLSDRAAGPVGLWSGFPRGWAEAKGLHY